MLSYTWFQTAQGFVRATLMKNRCDLVVGTVSGVQDMSTTEPYYHTGYMMVTRRADNITTDRVSDWRIAGRRSADCGHAANQPGGAAQLMDQTSIYQLMVDTRIDQPAHAMITDIAGGRVDVGLLWGPIAGYYARHDRLALRLTFLNPEESRVRLDYHIAMGIRPADIAFRRRLNSVIARDQGRLRRFSTITASPCWTSRTGRFRACSEGPGGEPPGTAISRRKRLMPLPNTPRAPLEPGHGTGRHLAWHPPGDNTDDFR